MPEEISLQANVQIGAGRFTLVRPLGRCGMGEVLAGAGRPAARTSRVEVFALRSPRRSRRPGRPAPRNRPQPQAHAPEHCPHLAIKRHNAFALPRNLCNVHPVNSASVIEDAQKRHTGPVSHAYLRQWMDTCDAFRAWERQEIFLSEPAATTVAGYRAELNWTLGTERVL